MRRYITAWIAVILLCWTAGLTAFATPGDFESGTIDLTTSPGGEVTIYRVGDVETDGFVLTGDYAQFELDDVQSAELAAAMAEQAASDTDGETKTVGADGSVTFSVEPGLYLIVQTGAGSDGGLFRPFLISMPNYEDGVYTNEVHATPKISTEPEKPTPTTPTTPTTPSGKLPQTGQLNWPIPLLAVSGLLLFVLGWVLRFRKGDYER